MGYTLIAATGEDLRLDAASWCSLLDLAARLGAISESVREELATNDGSEIDHVRALRLANSLERAEPPACHRLFLGLGRGRRAELQVGRDQVDRFVSFARSSGGFAVV